MKKILSSGATLEVTRSPFAIGHKLFKVTAKELSKVDLKLGTKGDTLEDLFKVDMGDDVVNTIKNVIATFIYSEEIEEVLWQCMDRAVYNNKKITHELFDDEKATADYLEIAKEVMVLNLTPFGKSLLSLLRALKMPNNTENQKSK